MGEYVRRRHPLRDKCNQHLESTNQKKKDPAAVKCDFRAPRNGTIGDKKRLFTDTAAQCQRRQSEHANQDECGRFGNGTHFQVVQTDGVIC